MRCLAIYKVCQFYLGMLYRCGGVWQRHRKFWIWVLSRCWHFNFTARFWLRIEPGSNQCKGHCFDHCTNLANTSLNSCTVVSIPSHDIPRFSCDANHTYKLYHSRHLAVMGRLCGLPTASGFIHTSSSVAGTHFRPTGCGNTIYTRERWTLFTEPYINQQLSLTQPILTPSFHSLVPDLYL